MDTKTAKYFVAHRIKGMSKTKAVKVAGISDVRNIQKFEALPSYKALEEKYKDVMLKHIGMDAVAEKHVEIINQDKDRGAQLNAIKLFLERVEPELNESKSDDQMIVVMRG